MFRNLALVASCLILFSTSQSHGAVILENSFTGATDGSSSFSTGQVTDVNVISPGVGRPGYTLNGGTDALVAAELRTFTADPTVLNFTRYFEFTITPINGAVIDFDTFTYNGFETLNGGATIGASKFALRSDFTGGFGSGNDIGVVNLATAPIDLSSEAGLQGVAAPIEFRLYIQSVDTAGTSPNTTFSLEDFSFDGTVTAVPEPSSLALLAIGGMGLVGRRRRRVIA